MNWHDKTIAAYDNSAQKWSDNFKNHGYGPRYSDIERALTLAKCNDKSAKVIEIGCGVGRDAQGIVENVSWYQGFDPSKGLLKLAKAKLPEANFVLADAQSYDFPSNIDVVFAFASLLHINKHDLSVVFKKVSGSLRQGGVIYMFLKENETYAETIRTDENGDSRMIYLYNPSIIKGLTKDMFEPIYEEHKILGHTKWFSMALKKL